MPYQYFVVPHRFKWTGFVEGEFELPDGGVGDVLVVYVEDREINTREGYYMVLDAGCLPGVGEWVLREVFGEEERWGGESGVSGGSGGAGGGGGGGGSGSGNGSGSGSVDTNQAGTVGEALQMDLESMTQGLLQNLMGEPAGQSSQAVGESYPSREERLRLNQQAGGISLPPGQQAGISGLTTGLGISNLPNPGQTGHINPASSSRYGGSTSTTGSGRAEVKKPEPPVDTKGNGREQTGGTTLLRSETVTPDPGTGLGTRNLLQNSGLTQQIRAASSSASRNISATTPSSTPTVQKPGPSVGIARNKGILAGGMSFARLQAGEAGPATGSASSLLQGHEQRPLTSQPLGAAYSNNSTTTGQQGPATTFISSMPKSYGQAPSSSFGWGVAYTAPSSTTGLQAPATGSGSGSLQYPGQTPQTFYHSSGSAYPNISASTSSQYQPPLGSISDLIQEHARTHQLNPSLAATQPSSSATTGPATGSGSTPLQSYGQIPLASPASVSGYSYTLTPTGLQAPSSISGGLLQSGGQRPMTYEQLNAAYGDPSTTTAPSATQVKKADPPVNTQVGRTTQAQGASLLRPETRTPGASTSPLAGVVQAHADRDGITGVIRPPGSTINMGGATNPVRKSVVPVDSKGKGRAIEDDENIKWSTRECVPAVYSGAAAAPAAGKNDGAGMAQPSRQIFEAREREKRSRQRATTRFGESQSSGGATGDLNTYGGWK